MKHFILLIVATALYCAAVDAQTLVRGSVKDSAKGEAVGYATVAAQREGAVLAAVASSERGEFELKIEERGAMTIEITAVGYAPYRHEIEATGEVIDLGDVRLTAGVEVAAVTIAVQKPIVTADAEKLTYSVEDDPQAQSSTLEDIIRKVPQLSLNSEGKVLMNGQSDYKILVNGHPSASMSRNFADIIKSMPASSIKRIEVITNPSMKYDAEGVGGVLNIITAKARFDGYNGSINISGSSALCRNWDTNNSANFTVQKNKFALSAGLYYSQSGGDDIRNIQDSWTENRGGYNGYKYLANHFSQTSRYHSLYGNVRASYQVDSLNLLTVETSVWGGRWGSKTQDSYTHYFNAGRELLYGYDNPQSATYPWFGIDAAVNYEHTFRREGHTLTVSDNISVTPPITQSQWRTFLPIDALGIAIPEQIIATRSRDNSLNNVLQVDYANPLTAKHSIEAGAKYSYDIDRQRSKVTTLDAAGDAMNVNRGHTVLTKHILGIYAGYAFTVEKFSARAGGRLEGAWYAIDNDDNGSNKRFDSHLFNIVPYASLTYMPKMGHSLSFSYTERLSRPGIWAMSPFVTEDVQQRDYGNPNLKTGVSHTLTLKYAYSDNKWGVSVGATSLLSNNIVAQYTFTDDEGKSNTTYANNARVRSLAGDVSLSFRPSAKFNLSLSSHGGWFKYSMPAMGLHSEVWAMNNVLNMTIALWRDARLTLTGYAVLPDQCMTTMRHRDWVFGTSAGINQKFLKEKLELSVVVNNPHSGTMKGRITDDTPTYYREVAFTQFVRSVRLSLTYRFGKQGLYVKSANRKIDDSTTEVGSTNGKAQMQ